MTNIAAKKQQDDKGNCRVRKLAVIQRKVSMILEGGKKNRLFPCILMRTDCELNTSGTMIINQRQLRVLS